MNPTHAQLNWPWHVLEIDSSSDEKAVRRAYASKLKDCRPEDNAEAFQQLRTAYEHALNFARKKGDVRVAAPAPSPSPSQAAPTTDVSIRRTKPSDASPQPADAAVRKQHETQTPDAAARQLWAQFVTNMPEHNRKFALRRLHDEIWSLAVRDALERQALFYCAQADVPSDVCVDIAEAFEWTDNTQHLERRHGPLVGSVMRQVMAGKHAAAISNDFPEALAQLRKPPCSSIRALKILSNASRFNDMTRLLTSLKTYPIALQSARIDPASVEFWTDRVALHGHFISHWVRTLWIGWFSGALLAIAFGPPGNARFHWLFAGAGGLLAIAFGFFRLLAFALLHFAPSRFEGRAEQIRQRRWVRLGWIVPWIGATAGAFAFPANNLLVSLLYAVLALTLEWAEFAHDHQWNRHQTPFALGFRVFATGMFGYFLRTQPTLGPIALVFCVLYPIFTQGYDRTIYLFLERRPPALKVCQALWLIGALTTTFLLVTNPFSTDGIAWAIYATLVVSCGVCTADHWDRFAQAIPVYFRAYVFGLWPLLANFVPTFALSVTMGLLATWVLHDLFAANRKSSATGRAKAS
jgi:hypothetical protein